MKEHPCHVYSYSMPLEATKWTNNNVCTTEPWHSILHVSLIPRLLVGGALVQG